VLPIETEELSATTTPAGMASTTASTTAQTSTSTATTTP
jgi:hypothetical protein